MDLGDGPVNAAASSTTRIPAAEGEGDNSEQNENVKLLDCDESSDSVSSLRVEKRKAADEVEKRELNIMHQDTLEATVLDLEELVNKVKWMQRILQSPATATASSWKFP